jgi:cobalt-precorrin 5A hydrolase
MGGPEIAGADMIAFGIGANSAASIADVELALQAAGLADSESAVIATLLGAPFMETVQAAGDRLGVSVVLVPCATLQARNADCQTHSERSLAAHGVPSIAEACALVGAGDQSTLIQPRQVCGLVTVAVALSCDSKGSNR